MGSTTLYSFNRGLVSKKALGRVDLKRTALSAEVQTNWMPKVLGPMSLRAGLILEAELPLSAAATARAAPHLVTGVFQIPFIFSLSQTAMLLASAGELRVSSNGYLLQRPAVSASVLNGDFNTGLSDWADEDEAGATSEWVAYGAGGGMSLRQSNTGNRAIRAQDVVIAPADLNKEHSLVIEVAFGIGVVRVGSTAQGAEYMASTLLRTGKHNLSFIPTETNAYITLSSVGYAPRVVLLSCNIGPAGVMVLPAPWTGDEVSLLRYSQSGDVIFVALQEHQPMRIERQHEGAWSLVDATFTDGPYQDWNSGKTTLTPSAIQGTVTVTASNPIFTPENVGQLLRIESVGQNAIATILALEPETWCATIRVDGVDDGRIFYVSVSGTFTGTVTLQQSSDGVTGWSDATTYTAPTYVPYDDTFDNQILYYRLGCKASDITSGQVTVQLSYASGTKIGHGLITGYTNEYMVAVDAYTDFGSVAPSLNWSLGYFGEPENAGWPSAVTLVDGRLWWAGKDKLLGSVSDVYTSYDPDVEGDSGPIKRSIGSGPVDTINWLLPLLQLLVGAQMSELVAKSSSLDEPMTPTQFTLKPVSTQGSAPVAAVRMDNSGLFVQRCNTRVYELIMDQISYSYVTSDITALVPEIGYPGITRMVVQRQPDTRIHCVRSDGKVAILVYDRLEKVTAWVLFETDGEVLDAAVLPGANEDIVTYVVRRNINGADRYYVERWAEELDTIGGPRNILSDATITYYGPATATITGLAELEGREVCVWASADGLSGADYGLFTVTAGQITLPIPVIEAYVGLPYRAQFKSVKLSLQADQPAPIGARQRIDHISVMLADTHYQGLRYGPSFEFMDDLPLVEREEVIPADTVYPYYAEDAIEFPGEWGPDSRVCLEAASPRPATVLVCALDVAGHFKSG